MDFDTFYSFMNHHWAHIDAFEDDHSSQFT